ncbi:MAG: PPC domain-containing protein [Deltaproteobacteria bacterium]|nr:PPC domain-containing protein [Deltaproteobacteria bacterium]
MAGAYLFSGCANQAPTFFPIGNKNIETGSTLEFEIKAIDGDGDALEFGITGKPEAAVFETTSDSSAQFSWTPIASDAGADGNGMQYNVVFLVTDGIDSSSEAITIFVTLGGAGTGAPVFITPSDYTLDLDRTDNIKFNVEVRDTDSANIYLRIIENDPGGTFNSAGPKSASYEWTPTEQQVNERPVWSIRVGADDDVNPEVTQDITILIKGGKKKCEGTPPTIEHDALPDQRDSGDYLVNVTADDKESEISAVALYWMIDTGGGDSFTKNSMTSAGGGSWSGSIPNPNLAEGETADVTYYICAVDDDDPAGSECDLRGCAPQDGKYTFTAYAAGNNDCEDDQFEETEGNDTYQNATKIQFDLNGESVLENMKICPGNVDWFQIQTPAANYWAGALIGYTQANGQLKVELYDQDGSSLLETGDVDGDQITVISDVFDQPKTVYLKIEGVDSLVENRYTLLAITAEYVPCNPDSFEPNNSANDAKTVSEDVYIDLTCCGDPDWYKIVLNEGDKLEVELEFTHANGDLDLWIFDQDTIDNAETLSCDNALGCSTTETDDEAATVESIPADGTYYIAMGPYQEAKNVYHMMVVVTQQVPTCTDDADESNDIPDEAIPVWDTGPRPGLVLCPGNEDWYKALMFADEILSIDLTFLHANGDLDMKLYKPGVTPETLAENLITSALSVDDDEHIEYTIPSDGDYFIRIVGWQVPPQGNGYSLEVTYP